MSVLDVRPHAGGYPFTNDFLSAVSWHTEVVANGDLCNEGTSGELIQATCHNTTNKWQQIIRTMYCFDTSSITLANEVSGVTLTLVGTEKTDNTGDGAWALAAYSASLNDNDHVTKDDYQLCGAILLSDSIAYASFDASGNNVLTFNATGLAYINRTGYTILCLRDATHDVADELDPNNHDPVWAGSHAIYSMKWCGTAYAGEGSRPLLSVTYGPVTPVSSPGDGAYFARRMARLGF
jgi:hypothetical protein